MRFGSFGWSGGAQKQFEPFVQALKWDCLGVVEYQGASKQQHREAAVAIAKQLAQTIKK
jgi:flavorubredoxin